MKIKYPVLLSFILFSLFATGQPTCIKTFDDLMSSLNSGYRVRVIIHYARCTWPADQEDQSAIPDAISGMDIDTYEYFAPGAVHNKSAFVVFANSKLIQNPLGKGFVYNYGKVRINADNSVQITAKYIHPKSFKSLMSETFNCKLSDGITNEGMILYK